MKRVFFLLFILFLIKPRVYSYIDIRNLTLDDAEKIALHENKPYLITIEDIYQADQRRLQAYSKWLPQINYHSHLAHTFSPSIVTEIDPPNLPPNSFYKKDFWINKFELTQNLFSTDIYFDVQTKTLEQKGSVAQSNSNKNDLLLGVRNYYYSTVFNKAALQIQRENVSYLSDALKIEEGRFEFGNSTSLEVNQSKVAVSNSISQYYNALKNLKNSRNALINSLGVNPFLEETLEVTDNQIPILNVDLLKEKLDSVKRKYRYPYDAFPISFDYAQDIKNLEDAKNLTLFSEENLEEYIDFAIRNRPDLHLKKILIDIAEEEVKKNRGKYFPKVSGFVDYQKNAADPGARIFSKDSFSWATGIRISWDLFDGLLRERKIKESLSKRSSSNLSYKYTLDNVEIEIRNILYQIEDAIYAHIFATEGVLLSEQAMIQAREKLQFGKITPLDYRDATNQLAKAKDLQNNASYQLIMSYYKLRYDTGIDIMSDQALLKKTINCSY